MPHDNDQIRETAGLLTCPGTEDPLSFDDTASPDGAWVSEDGKQTFPIVRGVPRFVGGDTSVVDNFGTQWNLYKHIQIDRIAGHTLSETRLMSDTGWTEEWLRGKRVLDAGCGAGRFTDVLAAKGANVFACDLSSAVDACFETCVTNAPADDKRGTVQVFQADLMKLPFRSGVFDAIHCAGVIQHTSDPEKVMRALTTFLKPGGKLFYNFYEVTPTRNFQAIKYTLRKWTPNWPMSRLMTFCSFLTGLFFWPSWIMAHIPVVRAANRFLPICSTHPKGIPVMQQYTMTLLDTIDWYGPVYETRQHHERVAEILREQGLTNVASDAGRAWATRPE